MDHEPVLISTIAIGLTAAFIGGLVARRVGLPVIVGYILAGVAIGPFTPGLVADPTIATELAELGVILLMFGVAGSTSRSTTCWPCARSRCPGR
jgi:Kef-type K+ transport system, predicted NAD-binding component